MEETNLSEQVRNNITGDTYIGDVPDAPMQTPPQNNLHKIKLILGAVLLIVILGVGGFFAYTYAFNTPTSVWNKFVAQGVFKNTTSAKQIKTSVVYTSSTGVMTTDVVTDYQRLSETEANSLTKLSFKSKSSAEVSQDALFNLDNLAIEDLEIRQIAKVFYFNVSKIPLISESMTPEFNGWVKIDLGEFESKADNKNSFAEFQKKFLAILEKHKVFASHKFESKETLDNQQTFAYSIVIDKAQLQAAVNEFIDSGFLEEVQAIKNPTGTSKVLGLDTNTVQQNHATYKADIAEALKSIDFKEARMWLNAKTYDIHKVELSVDSLPNPSVYATSKSNIKLQMNFTNSAEPVKVQAPEKALDLLEVFKSGFGATGLGAGSAGNLETINLDPAVKVDADITPDQQRTSDIRALSSSLQAYYNVYGKFPAADKNGFPIGLAPNYLPAMPKAPTPPGGSCTTQQNYYIYTTTADLKEYTLTFCLGSDTDGYTAGVHKAKETGIK